MREPSIARHASRRRASLLLAAAAIFLITRTAAAQPQASPTVPAEQRVVDAKAREAIMPGATLVAPKLNVPTISLGDAVTQAVTNQPQIKLGLQSVATRTGSVQRERGAFDWRLILVPNYEYNNTALDPSVRGDEKNRRLKFQVVAAAFGSINRQLLDQINSLQPRPP